LTATPGISRGTSVNRGALTGEAAGRGMAHPYARAAFNALPKRILKSCPAHGFAWPASPLSPIRSPLASRAGDRRLKAGGFTDFSALTNSMVFPDYPDNRIILVIHIIQTFLFFQIFEFSSFSRLF
jgi:hypothetical protein